jgi:hypothetical protein
MDRILGFYIVKREDNKRTSHSKSCQAPERLFDCSVSPVRRRIRRVDAKDSGFDIPSILDPADEDQWLFHAPFDTIEAISGSDGILFEI